MSLSYSSSVLIVQLLLIRLLWATLCCGGSSNSGSSSSRYPAWNSFYRPHPPLPPSCRSHEQVVTFPVRRKASMLWGRIMRGGSIQTQQQQQQQQQQKQQQNENGGATIRTVANKQQQQDKNPHNNMEKASASCSRFIVVSTVAVGYDALRVLQREGVTNSDSISLQPGCRLYDASSSAAATATTVAITAVTDNSNNNQEPLPFWNGEAQWNENSLALWHSLALVSDIVVLRWLQMPLLLPAEKDDDDDDHTFRQINKENDNSNDDNDENNNNILSNDDLIRALIAGLRQRTRVGNLSRGRLLVVVDKEDQVAPVTEYLSNRLEEFHDIDNILLEWQVCTTQSYHKTLKEQLSSLILANDEESTTASILDNDATVFSHLLQQVYRSVGGMLETTTTTNLVQEVVNDNNSSTATLSSRIMMDDNNAIKKDKETPDLSIRIPTTKVEPQQQQQKQQQQQVPITEKEVSSSNSANEIHLDAKVSSDDSSEILTAALSALDSVQTQLEARWTDPESLPIAFAKHVNPILQQLLVDLRTKPFPPAQTRSAIEQQVGARLQQLHQQHLNDLRDYFGVMYESLLDDDSRSDDITPVLQSAAAQRVSTAFQKAARESIPTLTRKGKIFHRTMYLDYMRAYEGLLSDMKEATELRQTDNNLLLEENNEIADSNTAVASRKQKKLPKWVKKLAARAIVLGINYLQGWLAWQGIRRAALERERNLPKFPLF